MRESYSTQEIASLFGITFQAIQKKYARESWQSRPRKGRGGGFEWLVASMPEETQAAIRKAEERKAIEEAAQEKSLARLADAACALDIMKPLTRQASLEDRRRYKALAKADLLDLYIGWQKKYGATVAQKDAFVAAYKAEKWASLLKELGPSVSWKTLERWKLEKKEAGAVLVLTDTRGIAHRGKSLITSRHQSIILGQILDGDRTISVCVRQIQAKCQAENLDVPSEDTIRRWVKKYSQTSFNEWTLFRKGEKAWNDNCAISILRDWTLVEVGDVVIADGHTLNFETVNPETGKPCRMTLLLFLDGRSRYPLGWEVMATENVACISSAFRRACIALGKFPKVVYLDNGKAFRAKFFKGCPDFEQAGFLGLYRDLGCKVIHAWPYHGQSKPIERFFGTMHEMEELAPSYTGWDIAHKPARMHRNEKLHKRLHEKLGRRPLTLEETHLWIAGWFEEYGNRPQTRTHLNGHTPWEVFEAGRGEGVDVEKLTLMMLQKEIRTIGKDGIRMFSRLYWSEELSQRRHPVLVRYDLQLSPYTVLVYDMDGKLICEARDRQHYKIAAGVHPAANVLGTDTQKKDLSDSVATKMAQARAAKGGIRQIIDTVVIPEAPRLIDEKTYEAERIPAKPAKKLTSTEKAAIEAAKDLARNEKPEPDYVPSRTMRFPDEPARYEYLFKALYEKGVELAPEDVAFMENFEATPSFQRNYKPRYDSMLELIRFRNGQKAECA
ncbi:MAG: Mu transposase C-terminal domain-containing protein [Desulfovibrio sp.]|nr:Mu transposase C-terminal domain-containing protein [Desulfovibrio sp.]